MLCVGMKIKVSGGENIIRDYQVKKRFLIFFIFSLWLETGIAQNSLQEIINDITLPHEGRPHGVPISYDWALKPRRGAVQPPESWTAMIAWGQLYEWIEGNPATNTRVQIKDMEAYYLSKSDGKWHLLQKDVRVAGAAYVEDFAGDVNKPADIRRESDGSVSVTAGDGFNFHFWPSKGRTQYPQNDVEGCFITVLARLILDDPKGVDDRKDARYVLSVGGDWWLSLTAQWDNWKTNMDMGIGRFKFVTVEWKSFNLITVPIDEARKNPPPFLESTGITQDLFRTTLTQCELVQNHPNPFNATTEICFTIAAAGNIKLAVYDLLGQQVALPFNGFQTAGSHRVMFDAADLPSGIYYCSFEQADYRIMKKIMLLR